VSLTQTRWPALVVPSKLLYSRRNVPCLYAYRIQTEACVCPGFGGEKPRQRTIAVLIDQYSCVRISSSSIYVNDKSGTALAQNVPIDFLDLSNHADSGRHAEVTLHLMCLRQDGCQELLPGDTIMTQLNHLMALSYPFFPENVAGLQSCRTGFHCGNQRALSDLLPASVGFSDMERPTRPMTEVGRVRQRPSTHARSSSGNSGGLLAPTLVPQEKSLFWANCSWQNRHRAD
jgi:hypothetical protein